MPSPGDSDLALAGLAHDLNNVFETIAEAAELLSFRSESSQLAASITRNVERGRRIVNSIVEQTRVSTRLDEVLKRAADFVVELSSLLSSGPIEIRFQTEPGLSVKGQPGEWERVFMNLFLNAAQAMRSGGTVEVQAAQTADGAVVVRVMDQGPGIPEAILDEIFRPNFSTREEHSGLGLHIVESIVERHGGRVKARNREDRPGALFEISVQGHFRPTPVH